MADLLKPSEHDAMQGRFMTFLIGQETFGIEIRHVMEIIDIQPITEVPETQDYIKGIINLRGRIIPVMDVRLRLKKPEKAYDDRTCVIVTDLSGMWLGLIVDRVSEVITIPEEEISPKPDIGLTGGREFVRRIGKAGNQVVLLLDCTELLAE